MRKIIIQNISLQKILDKVKRWRVLKQGNRYALTPVSSELRGFELIVIEPY